MFAVESSTTIRTGIFRTTGVSTIAVISTGVEQIFRDGVELGIFRAFEENVENTQAEYFLSAHSSYSFEDLTSDEIGFYLAKRYPEGVNFYQDTTNTQDAWRWLSGVCGFPEDKEKALEQSWKAYSVFGGLMGILGIDKLEDWGSPLLCGFDTFCAEEDDKWPSEFTTISSIPPQRGGRWWIYNENIDGELVESSSYPGFYFLR